MATICDGRLDRRNGALFFWTIFFSYTAGPVLFVGITQAALCDRLGASATVSNLPAASFFLGAIGPIFFASFVPHSWDRRLAVVSAALMAVFVAAVAVVLVAPVSNQVRIVAVVGQSLALGLLNSVNQVYVYQCLGRGTSETGRSRAMKLTYTVGPLAAVAASLLAQFILRGGIPFLRFPRDFALVHVIAAPCLVMMALCSSRFILPPLDAEPHPPFLSSLTGSIRCYAKSRDLILLWVAYLLFNCTLQAMPNLSLYTRVAMGREPSEFSGAALAIRFGCKALAGFGLGVLNLRYGARAPLVATVSMLGLAMAWAWWVPGGLYLASFGLMGAGELGGVYFPNTLLDWSPVVTAVRDMSILNLAAGVAGPAATLHGLLTDHWGFPTSFIFGIVTAVAALVLVLRLPRAKIAGRNVPPGISGPR